MSANLLNLFRENIEEQLVDNANPTYDIPSGQIRTFLNFLVPSLISGLIRRGSTESGAGEILGFLAEHMGGNADSEKPPQNLTRAGDDVLHFLLGMKIPEIGEIFTTHSGIPAPVTEQLLGPSSFLFMNELDRYVSDKSIDDLGLANLLSAQRVEALESIPPVIRDFPLFNPGLKDSSPGFGSTKDPETSKSGDSLSLPLSESEQEAVEKLIPQPDENASPFGKILPWIILALASLALLWFLSKKDEVLPEKAIAAGSVQDSLNGDEDSSAAELALDRGESGDGLSVVIAMPDGSHMVTSSNSFAKRFYDMITGEEVDTLQSFILDGVEFRNGTAELIDGSDQQLLQLARLMKAFPGVSIRVVAHTDDEGNAADNLDLTHQRADAIQNWLIENGIKPERVSIFGRGHTKPLASNETEVGRKQNRRIEVYLLGK